MKSKERLEEICFQKLGERITDSDVKNRLNRELKAISDQGEWDYFLELYDHQVRFSENENNLLVAKLLGLVEEVDLNIQPKTVMGDFPDVDTDYLELIREYLKNEWAPNTFGRENICSIGTYGTLGIKQALLDCARVYGAPKDEIQGITKLIPDKDDDMKAITWDKAIELVPALKDYCERHPRIFEAVTTLLDRNKSGGVHAGGLIISNTPIADFVPLEVRSVKKENKYGVVCSAWGEGQRTQDLSPVGLVKFDLLGVENLHQIALCTKLIKERHGIMKISAIDGGPNWSDTAYLNDPAAIAMANQADLKCIFQFGSEKIRKMVKDGGVTCFDDIAAYSALYRPGPIIMKMHERYCKRKRGLEKFGLHPLMRPILGYTYGVMVYQEQIMQILNIVGDIPLIHCEKLRKAISKKKVKEFSNYKDIFLENGKKNLNCSDEYINNLWVQIVAFSDYGFNKSHSYAYSYITSRQLYLKAHFPIEFYCASLMCESKSDKLKEIKLDAHQHGIEILPVQINESKENFTISSPTTIHYGFGNLKEIGRNVASLIVSGQPYSSFTDFLQRSGTDGTVVKALVSLDSFEEDVDRLTLFKFYEHIKKTRSSHRTRISHFTESMQKFDEQVQEIVDTYCPHGIPKDNLVGFTESHMNLWKMIFDSIMIQEQYNSKGEIKSRQVSIAKVLERIKNKRDRSISMFNQRGGDDGDPMPSLDDFDERRFKCNLSPTVEGLFIGDTKQAESKYYGFLWTHYLEESPDYSGRTLDTFLYEAEHEQVTVGTIEIEVEKVEHKESKKGAVFHNVFVEDANGIKGKVVFWDDDWNRFGEDLIPRSMVNGVNVPGSLVSLRVKPPDGRWDSFTFESVKRHERWKLPKKKEDDYRLIKLRHGVPQPTKTTKPRKVEEELWSIGD